MGIKRNAYPDEIKRLITERISYDPGSGAFTWKIAPPRKPFLLGKEAGYINRHGYRLIRIRLKGKRWIITASHIAWLIHTGGWPSEAKEIDHKDGNRSNDSIANLRLATRSQQLANSSPKPHKGYPDLPLGVTINKLTDKYIARIRINNKVTNLGSFDCCSQAGDAYRTAAVRLHGDFSITKRLTHY